MQNPFAVQLDANFDLKKNETLEIMNKNLQLDKTIDAIDMIDSSSRVTEKKILCAGQLVQGPSM